MYVVREALKKNIQEKKSHEREKKEEEDSIFPVVPCLVTRLYLPKGINRCLGKRILGS